MFPFLPAITFAAALLSALSAQAAIVEIPASKWSLVNFKEEDGGRAKDISGIACLPPDTSGNRHCLLVNDENSFAQWGLLSGTSISAQGERAPLSGAGAPIPLGKLPGLSCPGPQEASEFDGEAVALDAAYFYVIGSHGCGRNKGKAVTTSFLVARLGVGSFAKAGPAETTHRLAETLATHPKTAPYYGRQLENRPGLPDVKEAGLNLEGAAVIGGRLLAGLRAPVIAGKALVLSVSAANLYTPDAPLEPAVLELDLGGRGIRDLAAEPRGSLLILAGPAIGEGGDFALYRSAADGSGLKHLGALPAAVNNSKAETVLVLSYGGGKTRVLILYDGIRDGGPREFEVDD